MSDRVHLAINFFYFFFFRVIVVWVLHIDRQTKLSKNTFNQFYFRVNFVSVYVISPKFKVRNKLLKRSDWHKLKKCKLNPKKKTKYRTEFIQRKLHAMDFLCSFDFECNFVCVKFFAFFSQPNQSTKLKRRWVCVCACGISHGFSFWVATMCVSLFQFPPPQPQPLKQKSINWPCFKMNWNEGRKRFRVVFFNDAIGIVL